jgi:phosphoglycerate dehydrogenase-like enzyme
MNAHTLLVLAGPTEPQLAMLTALPPETCIAVGDTPEAFENAAAAATVILNWSGSGELLRTAFGMAPGVRWVHSRAAGLDGQLFPELIESPVPLTNGTGVFSEPLGEFVLGAILYFAKDFRRMVASQAAGRWDPFDIAEAHGRTVGIVGYGDIGRTVARRVHAMGMPVLALRRRGPAASAADPLVERVYGPDQRIEMIERCDYVVVSAPLTPETQGMIGRREIAAMKPEAVLINVGRGPVIDEAALVEALAARRIKGAALDVFDREPLPEGHPFFGLENLLLSPHCADHTPDWLERAMTFFIEQFERFRKGEPLLNVVDKRRGY